MKVEIIYEGSMNFMINRIYIDKEECQEEIIEDIRINF